LGIRFFAVCTGHAPAMTGLGERRQEKIKEVCTTNLNNVRVLQGFLLLNLGLSLAIASSMGTHDHANELSFFFVG